MATGALEERAERQKRKMASTPRRAPCTIADIQRIANATASSLQNEALSLLKDDTEKRLAGKVQVTLQYLVAL